jgi:hypothetical protein
MDESLLAKVAAVIISSLLSTSALAEPDQLDILGLIPGVSELSQVRQVGKNFLGNKTGYFEIGGHNIPCVFKFINGKLATFTCFTGKQTGTNFTDASNDVVHSDMKRGFTEKFGKPDSVKRNPVRTGMGVEYEQEMVIWKDKRGNEFQLISMLSTVSDGTFFLNSSEYLKQEAEKNAAAEAKKKF